MNAALQPRPQSARDRLRAHQAAVSRLHGELSAYNPLVAERGQLTSAAALIDAALDQRA